MTASVEQLVSHYQSILSDRMQGLPFVNDCLEVAAVGFRDFDEHSVGVLVSPWFMNLVVLPGTDEWSDCEQGSIRGLALPGETIEFNVCHDDTLGTYLTAALFRTVVDFPDQETASSIAEEILGRLFTDSGGTRAPDAPRFSRRDFFSRLGAER